MTRPPITIRHRTNPGGQSGWEAVTIAPVTTTHTIGLMESPEAVEAVVRRMTAAGMMAEAPIVVVA